VSIAASNWAFSQRDLTDGEWVLLLILADLADDAGLAWPSRATLARRCNKSADTIDRRLEALSNPDRAGGPFVSIERRNRPGPHGGVVPMANVFQLNLERQGSRKNAATSDRKSAARGRRKNAAKVGAPGAARVAASLPRHIDNPSSDPSLSASASAPVAHGVCAAPALVGSGLDAKALVAAAFAAAGAGAAEGPGTVHAADLLALVRPASGIACDWEADVIPAIQAEAASCLRRGKQIYAWSWIRRRALENRDRRLSGAPAPTQEAGGYGYGSGESKGATARERATASLDAGMLALVRQRRADGIGAKLVGRHAAPSAGGGSEPSRLAGAGDGRTGDPDFAPPERALSAGGEA
jgi:hypothetical protein